MSYHAEYRSDPRYMRDIFYFSHYQQLCYHKVVIDGEKLPYQYFSDPLDIALSLYTDSYLLYKCWQNSPSATPILI
jgi:hypothetical protein